jgi:hypothetical protein
MQRFFPGRSKEDTKILNAYCEMRLKVEEAEKLLVELVEHPEFDDAMAAGPEFKEDLETVLAARGLYDAGLKYVTTGKKK